MSTDDEPARLEAKFSTRSRVLLEAVAWGVALALAGALGQCAEALPNLATPFQPAAGVALVGLLVRGWKVLPGVVLGAAGLYAACHLLQTATAPWWLPALFTLALAVQAVAGAWGLRRFVGEPLVLAEARDIGRFVAVCAAAAGAGAAVATAAQAMSAAPNTPTLLAWAASWWFGQAAGSVIVAPMLLAWLGQPQADWQPRRALLALPMVVLATATGLGFIHVARLDAERTTNRFELDASAAAAQLSGQLLGPQHALEALRGLFLSGQAVGRQEFAQAAAAWLSGPGHVHAVGWSERLRHADIASFEARAHQDGFDGLRVLSATGKGGVRTVRDDEEIMAIRFIEPYASNRMAPGINSLANPAIGPVIAAAIRSGEPAATPAFPLRLPPGMAGADTQGVVVYRALYRGTPANDDARPQAAYGAVFATLRMSAILDSVAATVPPGFSLCLVDVSPTGAPARIAGAPGCAEQESSLTHRRALSFADRHWELRITAANGNAAPGFAWPLALIGFSGIAALVAMLLTVTGRARRVELTMAEAERAREAAVAASQAKSEFLSRMSHELRTPLNAVLGFAQLMEASGQSELAARHRRWVGLIRESGWHLLEMINDVLDLSRIESDRLEMQVESLSLQGLLEQSVAMVEQPARQRGINITLRPVAPEFTVRGDATRVRQILANLLSNAVKYNVERGRVEVSCREVQSRVEIEVFDTGPGLSAEQLAQLFQPFNRLGQENSNVQGTGIGLVISRRLAELMGGQLQVSSEVGKGTSFVLSLHRGQASEETRTDFSTLDDAGFERRPRVVHYIEDNPINAELMRSILASQPHLSLEIFSTAHSALAAMRVRPPDLILLDMHLPDMDGLELLRRIKAEPSCAKVPVVVVSANAMEAQVAAALHAGAVDYQTKPLHVRRFLATIQAVLAAPLQRNR